MRAVGVFAPRETELKRQLLGPDDGEDGGRRLRTDRRERKVGVEGEGRGADVRAATGQLEDELSEVLRCRTTEIDDQNGRSRRYRGDRAVT